MEAAATDYDNNKADAMWGSFHNNLNAVLQQLALGQYLILSKTQSNLFVQVVQQEGCLRAETISNNFRDDSNQLSNTQIKKLVKMGWNAPTAADSTPENDPHGSPNFYRDLQQPEDFAALAALLVQTLQFIGVADPADLHYEACDDNGNVLLFPKLGVMAVSNDLPLQVLTAVREITGQDQIEIDADGDIGPVYMGQSVTYLMIINDDKNLRIFSRVMEGVVESLELLQLLNTLNGERGDVHFYYQDGIILAMADVPMAPFVNLHLARVLPEFCAFADYSISVLEAELESEATVH